MAKGLIKKGGEPRLRATYQGTLKLGCTAAGVLCRQTSLPHMYRRAACHQRSAVYRWRVAAHQKVRDSWLTARQ